MNSHEFSNNVSLLSIGDMHRGMNRDILLCSQTDRHLHDGRDYLIASPSIDGDHFEVDLLWR